ncbi:MAG: hypothetical protein WA919_00630 [Coleofasciculaceae cyanobacterium]
MTLIKNDLRPELGDFSSIVCLKAIVTGIEDALGEQAAAIALISAGRQRGKQLAEELDLVGKGSQSSVTEIKDQVREALGKNGTCLCIVDDIVEEDDTYKVLTRESVCTSGEAEGSTRNCTYTLGAIQGLLEAFLNKRLRGQHTQSVLSGDSHDVLEFTIFE